MTCAEVREHSAAYALGALEPSERLELERHLAGPGPHEGCRAAVARAVVTAAALAEAFPEVRPDRSVWRAIEVRTGESEGRRQVGPLGWAAAAAAVAALVLVGVERRELRRQREEAVAARTAAEAAGAERDRLRATLLSLESADATRREALALLDRPGTRLVPLAPQPGKGARGVAIVNQAEGRVVVASTALPPRLGRTYQLWVIRGAAPPQPAGFLTSAPDGTAAGEIDRTLLAGTMPDAVAVSLEPAGGSPSPTEVLLVGRIAG